MRGTFADALERWVWRWSLRGSGLFRHRKVPVSSGNAEHADKSGINLSLCSSYSPPRSACLVGTYWTPLSPQQRCPQRLPLVALRAEHPVLCLRAKELGLKAFAASPTGEDKETLIRCPSFAGGARPRCRAIVHRNRIALEGVAMRADKRVSRLVALPFRRKTSEPERRQPALQPGQRGMFLLRFGDTFARCHSTPRLKLHTNLRHRGRGLATESGGL